MPGKFEKPRNHPAPQPRRSSARPTPVEEQRTPTEVRASHPRRRRRRQRVNPLPIVAAAVSLLAILLLLGKCASGKDSPGSAQQTDPVTTTAVTQPTDAPVQVIATASVSVQGDLLMHRPILTACYHEDAEDYSFRPVFQYMTGILSSFDYSVANLETTLGGPDFPYQGNPEFNCPDSILDSVSAAGYDMLLTANNHASDTLTAGLIRTVDQIRGKGLAVLGTQRGSEEPKYTIVEVNGIKIGMICYTYADSISAAGLPTLNFRAPVEQPGLINCFTENALDKFYSEMAAHIAAMKADGAEATILYIHWGVEYERTENATQRAIAQKMCDLGIDVIVGGHPHVVQPMALLQSTADPGHRTVCIYSLGNAVSNQMKNEGQVFEEGYSEDGALFSVTFEKYSDGRVYVADVNVIPTWVNRHTNNGVREYNILPLDITQENQWMQMFHLTDAQLGFARDSYNRTMSIVGGGLRQCRDYLAQAKAEREQTPSPAA